MIYIDTREASTSPTIYNSLVKLTDGDVETRILPIDYLIAGEKGEVFIERKTSTDFVESWRSGRIFDQLDTLSSLQDEKTRSMLVIEGSLHIPVKYGRWRKEGVMGILASTALAWNIRIVPTPSIQYTILLVRSINNMLGKTVKELHPIEVKPKALTLDEQARRIIESLPDIGPNIAERVLKHFRTPLNALTNCEIWDNVIEGIGEKTREKVSRVLKHEYGAGEV